MRSANAVFAAFATGLALLSGCGGDDTATSAATSSAGGGGAGGSPPVLDPHLFDCTASAPPERVTSVPVACGLDPTCTEKLVTGHRGVGGDLGVIAPEDTLAAVRAAVALGVDFVETDPRPTKDGVLVNMHDAEVDRTTDGSGVVADMTLAQVQALAIDATKYAGDFSCERVPTIEEVLLEARGKVHVLLDANKTDRVDLIVDAVVATDTLDWAIFDTDDVAKIDEALALEPSLAIMIRVSDAQQLADELAHFAPELPVIVEINDGGSAEELTPSIHAAGTRASTNVFITDAAAGLSGDAALYGEIFATGVDVVQTDRPDLVLRHLGRLP